MFFSDTRKLLNICGNFLARNSDKRRKAKIPTGASPYADTTKEEGQGRVKPALYHTNLKMRI